MPSPQEFVPSLLRDLLHAPAPVPPKSQGSASRDSETIPEEVSFLQVSSGGEQLIPVFGEFVLGHGEEVENDSPYAGIFDMLQTADNREEQPAIGPETASSMKELMGSLLPNSSPATFEKRTKAVAESDAISPQVSLADLAGQLVSRFAEQSPTSEHDLPVSQSAGSPVFPELNDSAGSLGVDWGDMTEDAAGSADANPSLFNDFSDLLGSGITGTTAANKLFPETHKNELHTKPSARRPLPLPAKPGSASRHGDVFLSLPDPGFSAIPAGTEKIASRRPATNDEKVHPGDFLESAAIPGKVDYFQSPSDTQQEAKSVSPGSSAPSFGVFGSTGKNHPASATAPETGGGLGSVLIGVALVILGLLMACTLPLSWLMLDKVNSWTRQTTTAGILLRAAGAAGLLTLGTGSIFQRRWAPPVAHALGWIGAFISSFAIALAAWLWLRSPNLDSSAVIPFRDVLYLVAGLLIPLGLILYYQRSLAQMQCDAADPAPGWTDGLAIPGVMVFLAGIALSTGCASMLAHYQAWPVPGWTPLTGTLAGTLWAGLATLGATVALASIFHKRIAWWLLLSMTLILAGGPVATAFTGGNSWTDFLEALGRAPSAPPPPEFLTGLIALLPVPLLLILAMSRRAFSTLSPSPDVR